MMRCMRRSVPTEPELTQMSSDRTRKIRCGPSRPYPSPVLTLSVQRLDSGKPRCRRKMLSPTMAPTAARLVDRVRGFAHAARSDSLCELASTRRG